MLAALFTAQALALVVVLARLFPGRRRQSRVTPLVEGLTDTTVSVIVPTLNEADRLTPCLAGLARQGPPLTEIIVVDGNSTDATASIVRSASVRDPRLRFLIEPPLPAGWIGKVWALEQGLSTARGDWVLSVDADTEAQAGMVAAAVQAARDGRLDMVSFSPLFAGQTAGERLIQPSLLMTLVYRCGAPGTPTAPERLLANGQCCLTRRAVLLRHGGYQPARRSFADDVTLARHLAREGVRVGFLDGSQLYRVRSYGSLGEMWREWGRSIGLGDVTSRARQWGDVVTLILVQAVPVPALVLLGPALARSSIAWTAGLLSLNAALLALHLLMRVAVRGSYERRGVSYWLSVLTDSLAVLRVIASTWRRPRSWRGRVYQS